MAKMRSEWGQRATALGAGVRAALSSIEEVKQHAQWLQGFLQLGWYWAIEPLRRRSILEEMLHRIYFESWQHATQGSAETGLKRAQRWSIIQMHRRIPGTYGVPERQLKVLYPDEFRWGVEEVIVTYVRVEQRRAMKAAYRDLKKD